METIAVYWENRAKTYGLQVERELSLFQVSTDPSELAKLGSMLFNDTSNIRFSWVLAQTSSSRLLKIFLLLNQAWAPAMQALIGRSREKGIRLDIQIASPVELVYFHGPHFGDRYGIADTALSTLRRKGLPILASGCTGASVYIVAPEKSSAEIKQILSDVFDTPNE